MDASILVVGGEDFLAQSLAPIRDSARFSIAIAADPSEAMPLIQAQQYDLLIIRASQPESFNLCHQVKSQSQLAWIYCILLEDQIDNQKLLQELGTSSQQPSDCQQPSACLAQRLQVEANALESGADAYLWLGYEGLLEQPLNPATQTMLQEIQQRHLMAQIQAGLRQVQNHRELMRTNDILSAIALSDPLTELNNRRALEWELPRQIQNSRTRGTPISVLMLDVDFFKQINDTYGHLVGDRALQLVAARLRHNLRFYDTPFRYGGEEFVIILSDTDSREARAIGSRVCRLIADQPFAINDTLDLPITISAGAATLRPEDDARGSNLLRRADQSLLKAKAQGRNRVVSSEESISEV